MLRSRVFTTKWSGFTAPETHCLPEAWAGVDDGFVAGTRNRIRREHHAGCGRIDHALHDDCERHAVVIDRIGIAIADRTIGPQ